MIFFSFSKLEYPSAGYNDHIQRDVVPGNKKVVSVFLRDGSAALSKIIALFIRVVQLQLTAQLPISITHRRICTFVPGATEASVFPFLPFFFKTYHFSSVFQSLEMLVKATATAAMMSNTPVQSPANQHQ